MDFYQIDRDLQKEYSTKKMKAEKLVSETFAKVNSNPAFKKLDNIERELVLEISKCKQKNQAYKNLKQNLETVRDEKNKILAKLNIKPSDLKPKYECKFCLDTGFVNGKHCECYKKERNKRLINLFGLQVSNDFSFQKFDVKICNNTKHAAELTKAHSKLQKWVESYPATNKKNIVITGKTGVGKTFLISCMANELIKKGIDVCFVSAYELFECFKRYRTTFTDNKGDWIKPFIESSILFIDDLGSEPEIKNLENYLYLILSERERYGRHLIITTNLSADKIKENYGERIFSRLFNEKYVGMFAIDGDDLRRVK